MTQPPQTPIPTFAQAQDEFLKTLRYKQKSIETIRAYKSRLNQLHQDLQKHVNGPVYIDMITEEALEECMCYDQEVRKLTNKSINHKISSISSFCTFAVKKKWLSYNPALEIDRLPLKRQEKEFLTPEEIKQILAFVDHPIAKYVISLMAYTGLRISEAINLSLSDVDFQEKVIRVIDGKGGKDRKVPMSKDLEKVLQHYLQQERPMTPSTNFFATKKTGAMSPQYVNRLLKEAAKKAGIQKHITSHTLRHSFASMLVQQNLHVVVISKLLGHADVRTTSVYMHAQQSELQKAVNMIQL